MKERKVGIITLALTLIALGVILTVHNIQSLDLRKTLQILAGVSIIALGVEFVWAESNNRKREEAFRLRVSGLCITLLICVYILSYVPYRVVIENGHVISNGFAIFDHYQMEKYEFERSYEENATGKQELELENRYGDITILPTDASTISIKAFIKVMLIEEDEDLAKEVGDEAVQIEHRNDSIRIATYIPESNAKVNVDYTIHVPKHMMADIVNRNGKIEVDGIKSVEIINKYDDVTVKNIAGQVEVTNNNGDIIVSGITGALAVENRYGDVTVDHIQKDVAIDAKNGKIGVQNVGGNLTINNQYDDVTVQNISGKVSIAMKNGNLQGKEIGGAVKVDSTYCQIELDQVAGDVEIENTYDSVEVTQVGGGLIVDNRNGKITAKDIKEDVTIKAKYAAVELQKIKGKAQVETSNNDITLVDIASDVEVDVTSGDVDAEKLAGRIKMRVKYGDIEIDNGDTLLSHVSIDNQSGNVTLDVPTEQEGEFYLYSKYGKIKTPYALTTEEQGSSERIEKGVVGNSDSVFSIEATSGDVILK